MAADAAIIVPPVSDPAVSAKAAEVSTIHVSQNSSDASTTAASQTASRANTSSARFLAPNTGSNFVGPTSLSQAASGNSTRSLLPIDPNGSRAGAVNMGVAQGERLRKFGSVMSMRSYEDRVDYFKFRVGDSALALVNTRIYLNQLDADVDLYIQDANGRDLFESDNTGSRGEYLNLKLKSNTTYYLKIESRDGKGSDYRLSVYTDPWKDVMTETTRRDHYGGYVTTRAAAELRGGKLHMWVKGYNYRSDGMSFTHKVSVNLLDSRGNVIYRIPEIQTQTDGWLVPGRKATNSNELTWTIPDHIISNTVRLQVFRA